jgi:anaerobic ribonucleoside-triphosphate reductase
MDGKDIDENDNTRVPCEVYSRVVGYLRPVQHWNDGKQQEFRDRRPFRDPFDITSPPE